MAWDKMVYLKNYIRMILGVSIIGLFNFHAVGSNKRLFEEDKFVIKKLIESPKFPYRQVRLDYALSTLESIDNLSILTRGDLFRFYVFRTDLSSSTRYVAVAIFPNGMARVINDSDSFNDLVINLDVKISDEFEALKIAKEFLYLIHIHDLLWNGLDGGVNSIQSVDDIEFSSDIEGCLERADLLLNYSIQGPRISKKGSEFSYDFYSWNRIDGDFRKHHVTIKKNGEVEYSKEILVTAYGDYHPCPSGVPIDPGPSANTLVKLLKSGDFEIKKAVAEYILEMAKSKLTLYEARFEILSEDPNLRFSIEDLVNYPDKSISKLAKKVLRKLKQ